MRAPGEPLAPFERVIPYEELGDDRVLVRVAGCGVCHTDLGFFYDGVRTGRPAPITLGHEIAGTVQRAAPAFAHLVGQKVAVPAVIPCGRCALCRDGHGSICRAQVFVGSDLDGGFASHVIVPGRGLCVIDDDELGRSGLALAELAVLADAVSTPYQAVLQSKLAAGDVAIFVGVGGVGGFGAQIAHARGGHVIAIDVDPDRLALAVEHGAELALDPRDRAPQDVRKEIAGWVKSKGYPAHCWKIFETSGRAVGQQLAFGLLGFGAHLSVVGFTLDTVTVRLANLMAFNATAQGNWGCLPELYPGALRLLLDGRVKLHPYVERHPLSRINQVFADLHAGRIKRRPVLVPDFA
jgi:6-hydroxycyclohex-1-ene-1-carbonyl-CoA dehydrogenase